MLTVRRVPISDLVPDPANPRSHPDINLDAIVASLRRFGQAEPLIVQTGTLRVIAGHGRLLAMRKLGWPEADVVELDVTGLDATALGIALNRTAELAAWDDFRHLSNKRCDSLAVPGDALPFSGAGPGLAKFLPSDMKGPDPQEQPLHTSVGQRPPEGTLPMIVRLPTKRPELGLPP
jgi:hypothetical protein